MLEECKKRVESLGYLNKSKFVQGNVLNVKLERHDSALAGFLVSHFTKGQELIFFKRLSSILVKDGTFVIIDGAWTKEREKVRKKEEIQYRKLNDGRIFEVYKKYFKVEDIKKMSNKYKFVIKDMYFGEVFLTFIARFYKE